MIQVYKEAFKGRASALKALINVYHTLFFIIPALQSVYKTLADLVS
jgi:hypothetical protein